MRQLILSALLSLAAALTCQVAGAAEKVTFVTDFGFNGRHAYYYVALDKGYYAAEGLEVTIVRGQGSSDAVKQVAAGTAQIGFADASAVILGRGNDGVPVKLVSIIYAKPPHAIFVLKESGVRTPKDLEGKRIADTAYSAMPKLFAAYARAAGIDAAKVTWLVSTSDALPGMLSLGRVDGIGQYTVGEPLLAKSAAPKEVVQLAYSDVGLDFYGAGLIASDKTIAERPETVRAFVRATLRGLADAVVDPAKAGEILNKYQRQIDVAVGSAETAKVGDLVRVAGAAPGSVDPARMQKTLDFISDAYDLKQKLGVSDILAPGFVAP